MVRCRIAGLAAALLVANAAAASTWEIAPATRTRFAVRHLLVLTVSGQFGATAGTVVIDEQDLARSSVSATIDVASIDTQNQKRDDHLRSADYFDAQRFPAITFASRSVRKLGERRYEVAGDLTMHGVTREVVLDVEGSPPASDPAGTARLTGVARTKIDRTDFGITAGGFAIGDTVDVTIDVELVRGGDPAR